MSDNLWAGLLLGTQAASCVQRLPDALAPFPSLFDVERLRFVALKGTRKTWVTFDGELDEEFLEDEAAKLAVAAAKKLKTSVWLVISNDYSGRVLCSADAKGKKWLKRDSLAWEQKVLDWEDSQLEKGTPRREVEAAVEEKLTKARARTATGRFEDEVGHAFDDLFSVDGEAALPAAWRKRVAFEPEVDDDDEDEDDDWTPTVDWKPTPLPPEPPKPQVFGRAEGRSPEANEWLNWSVNESFRLQNQGASCLSASLPRKLVDHLEAVSFERRVLQDLMVQPRLRAAAPLIPSEQHMELRYVCWSVPADLLAALEAEAAKASTSLDHVVESHLLAGPL